MKLVKASFLFLFLALSAQAQALTTKAMFGKQDYIRYLADTSYQDADGRKLYIGHRITVHAFLMPYFVENNGLVLGIVSGDPKQHDSYGNPDDKRYYKFPAGEKLASLQRKGYLPKELPKAELKPFDYLLGYFLELFVIFICAYFYFTRAK